MTEVGLHPLRLLATSDLVAFAKSLCEDDARGAQFIKALEAYVDTKRGGLRVFDRLGQTMRRIDGNQRFHAKELQLFRITLDDIMQELLHGETAQPLVTTQVAVSVEDWICLGVVNFEDLILRVGKPHTLKKWYGPKQWEKFVEGIHKNEGMAWDGHVWLHCVSHLDHQDYVCMGITLSFWFDHDDMLFAEAIGCAKDWVHFLTPAQWKECAHLEDRHYVQLAGVARTKTTTTTITGSNSTKKKELLDSWVVH
jgi:hypothetical protein